MNILDWMCDWRWRRQIPAVGRKSGDAGPRSSPAPAAVGRKSGWESGPRSSPAPATVGRKSGWESGPRSSPAPAAVGRKPSPGRTVRVQLNCIHLIALVLFHPLFSGNLSTLRHGCGP
jgi:hypothetical protein